MMWRSILVCLVGSCALCSTLCVMAAIAANEDEKQKTEEIEIDCMGDKTTVKAVGRTPEERLIDGINKYRARWGYPPLHKNEILTHVAQERAPRMSPRLGGMNHHVCGCWAKEHCHREGFVGPCQDVCAELHDSPEQAVDSWGPWEDRQGMKGHNYALRGFENINNGWYQKHYDSIGVGIYGGNYIAIMGRNDGARKDREE